MKTINLSESLALSSELLDLAREEVLILQTPDGREFVLAQIDEFRREVELTRQTPELMELLEQRGRSQATVSLSQVQAELGELEGRSLLRLALTV